MLTSWLSEAEDWTRDYRKQIQLVVRPGIERGASEFQVQRPYRSATPPPIRLRTTPIRPRVPLPSKTKKTKTRSRTKPASFQLYAFWYFVDASRKGLMCNAHLWWSEYWIKVFCNVHLPLRIFMHLMLPHDLVSCMSLWLHFLPPCRGSGLLHWRWRLLTPPPQVLEHWLNSDHLLRPPLTRNRRSTFNLYIGSIDTRGEVTPDESLRTSA